MLRAARRQEPQALWEHMHGPCSTLQQRVAPNRKRQCSTGQGSCTTFDIRVLKRALLLRHTPCPTLLVSGPRLPGPGYKHRSSVLLCGGLASKQRLQYPLHTTCSREHKSQPRCQHGGAVPRGAAAELGGVQSAAAAGTTLCGTALVPFLGKHRLSACTRAQVETLLLSEPNNQEYEDLYNSITEVRAAAACCCACSHVCSSCCSVHAVPACTGPKLPDTPHSMRCACSIGRSGGGCHALLGLASDLRTLWGAADYQLDRGGRQGAAVCSRGWARAVQRWHSSVCQTSRGAVHVRRGA